MTPHELAQSIVSAWAAPRKHPPSVPLVYLAEKAYWQAQNFCHFEGTLEQWLAFCTALAGQGEAVPSCPAAPPPPVLSDADIEAWLR